MFRYFILLVMMMLASCKLGPNYHRAEIALPKNYKESPHDWQIAKPNDEIQRGEWWKLFQDDYLNQLESQLLQHNQTIQIAEQNYRQAKALVDEARAQYFPNLDTSLTLSRGKQGNNSIATPSSSTSITTTHTLNLNATWEIDIWGTIRRNVEASKAAAQASAAQIASAQLSTTASLAQYYFELRTLNHRQQLLNHIVQAYQKILHIVQNQYQSGIAAKNDILIAENNLESAKTQALNNQMVHAQFEHAIAVLIGVAPADFSFASQSLNIKNITIPKQLPATLLQRRPDIATAERLMAQANAHIGVAIGAYFPIFNLLANGTSRGIGHWFNKPALSWALGPSLAEILLDGGSRSAVIHAAKANYQATVANYRQTVLTAFQEVEDNLVSRNILMQELNLQNETAKRTRLSFKIKSNQYQAGIANQLEVLTAQIAADNAEINARNTHMLKTLADVALIKSLGGRW